MTMMSSLVGIGLVSMDADKRARRRGLQQRVRLVRLKIFVK